MRAIAFISMVILLSGCAHVERKRTSDYDIIRTAHHFSIGRISDAGVFSDAEIAFRTVLKQADGTAQFENLLSTATPEGQLYGLLGLRLLDKRAFDAVAHSYLASSVKVAIIEGCSRGHSSTKDIARKISKGHFK
jgi:hypothetical protein